MFVKDTIPEEICNRVVLIFSQFYPDCLIIFARKSCVCFEKEYFEPTA